MFNRFVSMKVFSVKLCRGLLALFCLVAGISGALAQQPLALKNINQIIISRNNIAFYEDKTNKLNFEDIQSKRDLFKINQNFQPADYNTNAAYWVKIDVVIPKVTDNIWILEFYDQTIDELQIFSPTINGTYKQQILGDFYPFKNKPIPHKNFETVINPKLEGLQTYYFRIKSHVYADLRVSIKTVDRFINYSLNEYIIYGFFYGMILIITLYNLLIYFAIREIKYLFYTFYILSVGVYAMCVDGIAFQYLWPQSPGWNQIAYGVTLYSLMFWALFFGKKFLNTKIRAPKINKALNIIIVLRSLWFLYALFFDHSLFQFRNIEIILLLTIFYASIHVLIRGYKPARFFVMAYGIMFMGFLTKAMVNMSIIPVGIVSYYSLHIAFLLEMLFLTFALSDRVRILKANRDKALRRIIIQHETNQKLKDKVNRELEARINNRTIELQQKNLLLKESNEKLFQQTTEINKINSLLDLDNWKLKNNIKEILQDRLINKNLTLSQFNEIFPDQISCFRFLDRLKWGNGYGCLKCSQTKYSKGSTKFSRRCTKCGYDESVTSNTVFHRLKFPIEKAFYILYITLNNQQGYTLDELSETLDLRRNTVWTFKKKIEKLYENDESNVLRIKHHQLFNMQLSE